jgi:hypothetical protein
MKLPLMASTVVTVDPRNDPHWQKLAVAGGSLFTSPPWIRSVCDTYGFTPQARVILDVDAVPRDGFAWVDISDIRGDRRVSLPFSDRAEPMVSDLSAWPLLVEDAIDPDLPLTIRCFDGAGPTSDPRFERSGEAAWHGTNLDVTTGDLHQSLHPSTKRSIASAQRRGVEVRAHTGVDAVRTFHDIHVVLRKNKYRLLAQPFAFFERIWEEFSATDGIVTMLAYADDDPIAGAVLLAWGNTLYLKFAASRADALSLMPNYAVYWQTIAWAAEHGFASVDWGLSDLDQPGLVAYKRKWVTTESRIITLRTPGDGQRQTSDCAALLEGLTTFLTDDSVPNAVTADAGSLLYRYFT